MNMSDKLHTRDQAELGFLMQYFKEFELTAELLKPSDELAMSALVLPLMQDHKQRDRFLTFSFIPLSEDETEHIRLLQMYAVIPAEWKEGARPDVERMLHSINNRTAIGHFSVNDAGEISYRYVYSVSGATILPKHETIETVDLFCMTLDMFSEAITSVADGSISLNEALRSIGQ